MATAGFILSTGRTSTQNIAALAEKAYPQAIVDHEGIEGLGPYYFSRKVFRRPRKFAQVLGSSVPLQRKFIAIEDAVADGTPYVDAGWPVYAWLPYLADRFGAQFRFAHLVRNPFQVAASLTTHGLFSATSKPSPYQRFGMVDVSDPAIHYSEIASRGANFSAFERNLFHWLELNQFFIEQHDRDGFLGVFHFEDLYTPTDPQIGRLLGGFVGDADLNLEFPPVDRVQRKLKVEISDPDPMLVDAVVELAVRLGYREDELLKTLDLDALNDRYSKQRL